MDTLAVFLNPITHRVESIPVEMISAYAPYSFLHLQDAARVAAIRDDEEANNFLLSLADPYSVLDTEGCGFDHLSVPFPY